MKSVTIFEKEDGGPNQMIFAQALSLMAGGLFSGSFSRTRAVTGDMTYGLS
jgi:hypothetical protein